MFKPDIRELTLERGVGYASDIELLMLILGSGTKDIPVSQLAMKVEKKLLDCDAQNILESLLSIRGMGLSKAAAVAASIELGRRRNCQNNAVIRHPKDIVPFVRHYAMSNQEHFICVSLTGAHEIIKIRVVSIGTLDKTLVHPREVFSEPLKDNAAAIIVCHNHPSGKVNPSDDDIHTTELLLDASAILGIQLLDHIIFDKRQYYSFVENAIVFGKSM